MAKPKNVPDAKDNSNTMIRIPAGTWHVGSTPEEREELGRRHDVHPSMLADELDARQVSLPEFYIDEYPVTNAEYAAFLAATGHPEPYDWQIHGTAGRADHPVAGVGGDDAAAYADWAGKRLPTPEEWEAAFHGAGQLPARSVPADSWTPQTHARAADPGPVSAHGVHGLGQVTEWTCRTKPHGPFTFRLLKGAWWLCEEPWGLRPAAASWVFSPWRAWWTGLRCVSDRDVGPAPAADLPAVGAQALPRDSDAAAELTLSCGGSQSVAATLPGLIDNITMLCPEGWNAEDEDGNALEYPKLVTPPPAATGLAEVAYTLETQGLEMHARFRAGCDFFDMDYTVANSRDKACSVQPSTCVNPGLTLLFYDFEGARTYFWMGHGDWRRARSLPREGDCPRWISNVSLPEPPAYPAAILIGVVSRDGKQVFGYGRTGLERPPSLANNWCYSCLHVDPAVVVPAGGSAAAHARLYCMRGGLDDLREWFAADFGLR